ncbi:MAG: hypothetical protein IKL22_05630 [Lachnospiraceae bacterium]|nr:hypothetical protein [Lachnospiraceae bacterium]
MERKTVGGYLTIYVALSMAVLISLCLTLIEGARRNTIRLETECMMDTALSSVMAEYHREMFRQYNLFYIDSSYGSGHPSYYNTEARLRYYLDENMKRKGMPYVNFLFKDMLALEVENVWVNEVVLATDMDGRLFRKRAAEAIWNDSGMETLEQVTDWVRTIQDNGLMERDLEAEKQAVDAQLASFNGRKVELTENEWIVIEIKNPTEHINRMRARGVLIWVLKDGTVLSGQKVDLSQYISSRQKRGKVNRGNGGQEVTLSVLEESLFREYMLRYGGHYCAPKEGSLLQYQVEYVIAGKDKDTDNLRNVALTISGIREVANVIYLNNSKEKSDAADLVAKILAYAIFTPEAQPFFKNSLILGWGYLESLYDTKVLLSGGKVPLMKEDEDWHYDLDSFLSSDEIRIDENTGRGMSYEDYLRVLLYLENPEKSAFRFMDLMEMDIRMTFGNESFRMDACVEAVGAEATVGSRYGYAYSIDRKKEYH